MLIIKTSYFDVETTKQMWHVKKAMNTYSTSSQGFKSMQQHDTEKCMHSIFNRQGVCTKNTFCWVHYYFNAKTFLNLWSNRRPFLAPLAYCRIQIIRFISGHEYNLLIILQDVMFHVIYQVFWHHTKLYHVWSSRWVPRCFIYMFNIHYGCVIPKWLFI